MKVRINNYWITERDRKDKVLLQPFKENATDYPKYLAKKVRLKALKDETIRRKRKSKSALYREV